MRHTGPLLPSSPQQSSTLRSLGALACDTKLCRGFVGPTCFARAWSCNKIDVESIGEAESIIKVPTGTNGKPRYEHWGGNGGTLARWWLWPPPHARDARTARAAPRTEDHHPARSHRFPPSRSPSELTKEHRRRHRRSTSTPPPHPTFSLVRVARSRLACARNSERASRARSANPWSSGVFEVSCPLV